MREENDIRERLNDQLLYLNSKQYPPTKKRAKELKTIIKILEWVLATEKAI